MDKMKDSGLFIYGKVLSGALILSNYVTVQPDNK